MVVTTIDHLVQTAQGQTYIARTQTCEGAGAHLISPYDLEIIRVATRESAHTPPVTHYVTQHTTAPGDGT